MNSLIIAQIDRALKLRRDYKGIPNRGEYLQIMDRLAYGYRGAPAQKVSSLLDDYFKEVGVSNLKEALQRLRNLEN